MKRIYEISVRSFVSHTLKTGDLESAFIGSGHSLEAIRAHQAIQKSRPKEYTPEVTLSHRHESENLILQINGRVDGIFEYPDRIIIDEIKTTKKDLEYFTKNENPLHWGQVLVYAYIYSVKHKQEILEVQLTYYHLETREIKTFKKSYSYSELESNFNLMVESYLKWANALSNWADLRDESIKALSFPYDTYRPGQRQMAVDTYLAIKKKCHLIVEAPTGIGKTIAAIFPSVKAISENLVCQFFYLTARTTGKVAAQKAMNDLRARGLRLKSIEITAKDRICPNEEATCTAVECELAKGYYDRLNEAMGKMFEKDEFSREAIESIARDYKICPFEFSLDISIYADAIICDYNYAFDPKVYLRRFFTEKSENYSFLIDEAHNLVDRARDMFSAELYKKAFLNVRKEIKDDLPNVYKQINKINTWFNKTKKQCSAAGNFIAEGELPLEIIPLLKNFVKQSENWLIKNIKTPYREKLTELYFEANGFLKISEKYDTHYKTCYELTEEDVKVKLFCLDPSYNLKEVLKRSASSVFFSATLSPLSYYKHLFGCDDSAYDLNLPSPFPNENLYVVTENKISTYYKDRNATKYAVANAISTFINQKCGNYLIFFPSYDYMVMLKEILEEEPPPFEIEVQSPSMSEEDKNRFLNRFVKAPERTVVGFAVMGGIFGEGIDLVGERLSGAAIIGVGLPGISNEKNLIVEYFDQENGWGFDYAYVYPGINRVLQAAGRVIRSKSDYGVILLIDKRFSSAKYQALLPGYWHPDFSGGNTDLEKKLITFWESKV